MATVKLNSTNHGRQFGNNPYGNMTVLMFSLATLANGAAAAADVEDPIADGDVIDLGPLPEGMRLDDAQILVATGMSEGITGSLGFKYEDGEPSTLVPEDPAYFGTGLALAAAGRVRATGTKLAVLPKPARLTLTVAGAADNAKVSDIKVLVSGELLGPR